MGPADLTVDALATFRLTRLLVDDGILDGPRAQLYSWLFKHEHEKLLELARCSWCVSVWVGFGVVAARRVAPRVWAPAARALAFAAVAGVVSEKY